MYFVRSLDISIHPVCIVLGGEHPEIAERIVYHLGYLGITEMFGIGLLRCRVYGCQHSKRDEDGEKFFEWFHVF
jgi:hypothetical protein